MSASRTSKPIKWLHISDLHLGCKGKSLWWQVQDEFQTSLKREVERIGPPDLVLITGDLAFKGITKEYGYVNQFIENLFKWLRDAGASSDPIILPVPGNHDLKWPNDLFNYLILDTYNNLDDSRVQEFKEKLWKLKKVPTLISRLFKDYKKWFEKTIPPQFKNTKHRFNPSRFPGDFSVELNLWDKTPLVIVGLNSAWMQYCDSDKTSDKSFEKKIELPEEQFQQALPKVGNNSPLSIFEKKPPALLMMHHPPDWQSRSSQLTFNGSIYTPDRFSACLFGHKHFGQSRSMSAYGENPHYFYQSPSLFGVKHYGTSKEIRSIGYSFGDITPDGEVHIWPLKRAEREGATAIIAPDLRFKDAAKKKGHLLNPGFKTAVTKKTTPKKKAVTKKKTPASRPKTTADFKDYLKAIIAETNYINISGIGFKPGAVKDASRYPIEDLYVPLSSHSLHSTRCIEEKLNQQTTKKRSKIAKSVRQSKAKSIEDPELLHAAMDSRVVLQELLSHHHRLLIEGQPGSGKTTFLRFMSSMLARDRLKIPCSGGETWRKKYLGMNSTDRARMPVFLRISHLLDLFKKNKSKVQRRNDRRWIIDLLAEFSKQNKISISAKDWRELLEQGEAILLLDGLDEVADVEIRERVFSVFHDAAAKWKDTPIVVTSRPIKTKTLSEMDFGLAKIESFGSEEISTFIHHWITALHDVAPEKALTTHTGRYRNKLIEAILDNPTIRLLAANPVMLTCLCVVHWNDGNLPEGRSRVYSAVIRWLIASRREQRMKEGYTDRFAERGLARIALGMMHQYGDKRVSIDLEAGARMVESLVKRDFPSLKHTQDRGELARRWLRFECLGSNIIEEVSGNKIRFWHLTFQEFLAARQLAWLKDDTKESQRRKKADLPENWWTLVKKELENSQWRETIELFPGCLLDEGGEGRVDQLLECVLRLRGTKPSRIKDAKITGIMSRLIQSTKAFEYNPDPNILSQFEEARQRALEIFNIKNKKKIPVKDRIEAAEALGQGGDPRLTSKNAMYLNIPGMKNKKLGIYPVTVEEYRGFVDARCYEQQKYWDERGWMYRNEQKWEAPGSWVDQLKTPNRPVVRVSWYEACAYCNWLSAMSDKILRLPTESEWEAASKPKEGEYPWGRTKPNPELANYGDNVRQPTPVGVYPEGVGSGGHFDLAGNVWEWCLNETEESESWKKDNDGESVRALRGGCCWDSAEYLRFSARDWYPAWSRSGFIGFRVLSAPASTVDG